jgi:hypothetical protein
MRLSRLWLYLRRSLLALALIAIMGPEWPAVGDEGAVLSRLVGLRQFDFLVWEVEALVGKGEAALAAGDAYLDEAARRDLVLDYLAQLADVRRLEADIRLTYARRTDGSLDPGAAEQQRLVDERRRALDELRPLVEAIIQEQVATVLVDERFGLLGQAWPPVQMHMTPLPSVLIVSPRDEIRQLYGLSLAHGLPVASQEELEVAVLTELDRSALVVPIGGMGLYPAMVVESDSVAFLTDVTAHEWAHHWLTLRPVGIRYAADGAMRTINETVASIVGTEVGAATLRRYYPDNVPAPAAPRPADQPEAAPAFDFRAEMAATRVQVDALLAAGKITEAEGYMEAQRQMFVSHGYLIRKLNQAYFAFYGAYADTPGATGSDPIGPALLRLRQASPSLRAFMDAVAPITNLEELLALAPPA